MKISDFTPGQYRVTVAYVDAIKGEDDYIRQLSYGLYRTLEQVQEAIATDKMFRNNRAGDAVVRQFDGKVVYKIHFCPEWQEIDLAGQAIAA